MIARRDESRRRVEIEVQLQEARPIPPASVRALYDAVAWWPGRTEVDIAAVLARDPAVGAWDGSRLVGFARLVSDGRLRAYVEDVVVHPDYRRKGIGRSLVCRLVASTGARTISLFAEDGLVDLYGSLGFVARRSQVVMHLDRGN
jgi:ribosomal protein S18 acetylase RimI-like enzyme